ncbi:MAG: aldehyde dehydrogenase [Acidobacteriota bacterium]|nr:aldehyde dehydrogenase [Acidobacteriota bacterium]
MKLANYIGGRRVDPVEDQWLDSYNPSTGEVSHQVPSSTAVDVDNAVAAAGSAFPDWAATPAGERAAVLNRIADLLEQKLELFAEAESSDQGKPVSLARGVDIPRACTNFRFFAGAVIHQEDAVHMTEGSALNYTHRKPVGVAGLISPWNLPLYLLTWKIAPALAVGNTAVCKPSELTSLTAYMLTEVFDEAGLPPGVCNMVFGAGPQAGAALVAHPDVPLISFTGGTATATSIIRDSAPYFKKLGLELGGKNANIIFADADLDNCIPTTVRSSFANQGEICLCGSRIFVQRPVYEEFLERFTQAAGELVVGDPKDPDTNLGALVSAAHRDKVESYISLAGREGGTVILGGNRPGVDPDLRGGYYLEPTVITGLTPSCRVMTEEIFGPVVTVTPFDTAQEAVAYANMTRYGLSGTVWTTDLNRGHQVAQAMDAGVIWVNTWLLRDLRTPFGGMKASGVGREGGKHSLDFYTETQNICIKQEPLF